MSVEKFNSQEIACKLVFRELETWKHVIKLENYTRGQSHERLEFLALGRNTPISS